MLIQACILTLIKKIIRKVLKVGNHVRISKYKKHFWKSNVPNWSEKVFVIKKVKNTVPWTYLISDLSREDIVGTFHEKELQETNQKEFRVEKVIKKKVINYMLNGTVMIICLIVGLIKKAVKISERFPELKSFGEKVRVELDLN